MQQFAILSRAPQRILAAQTEEGLREIAANCLRGLFPRMMQFELFTRDAGGDLGPTVRIGEGQVDNAEKLLSSLAWRVRTSGGDMNEPQAFEAKLGTKRGPLMSAPLLDNGEGIGVVIIEGVPGAPQFKPIDLDVLEGVAALLSLALQRLRSKETEYAQVLIERDLKTASVVQRKLMSRSLPPGFGITSVAEYVPAFEVGGDFYDVVPTGPGKVSAIIGDVSGKGVTAALVMARVLSELRRQIDLGRAPADVLAVVNAEMFRDDSETFATASCLSIDARARTLEIASAGHLPVLIRRASGQVFTFGDPSGTPLGMLESDYVGEVIDLDPGDIVILMTDGLVEALDRPSDRMGMQLLLGLIKYAPHDPKTIIERLLAAVRKMKGPKLGDDVTLVALQIDEPT